MAGSNVAGVVGSDCSLEVPVPANGSQSARRRHHRKRPRPAPEGPSCQPLKHAAREASPHPPARETPTVAVPCAQPNSRTEREMMTPERLAELQSEGQEFIAKAREIAEAHDGDPSTWPESALTKYNEYVAKAGQWLEKIRSAKGDLAVADKCSRDQRGHRAAARQRARQRHTAGQGSAADVQAAWPAHWPARSAQTAPRHWARPVARWSGRNSPPTRWPLASRRCRCSM